MGLVTGYDDGLQVLKNPTIVTDFDGAKQVVNSLEDSKVWSFDIEATSLYFREAHHHGVAVADQDNEWYITYNAHPAFYAEAKKQKLFQSKWSFMHNMAYDVPFVHRYIPGIPVKVFDTMIAQHTIDENQRVGLKPLAQSKLGAPKNLADFAELQKRAAQIAGVRGHTKMRVTDMPFTELAMYAMRDVRYTYDLGVLSAQELREVGMWDVYMNYILPFFPVILEMEAVGVFIDKQNLADVSREYHDKLSVLKDKWALTTEDTNPKSPPQMKWLLYEHLDLPIIKTTKKGAPATDSKTIKRLIDRKDITDPDHPLKLFVEISKLQTLVDVIDTMGYSIDPITGRVYSKFNQAGAKTGRMSSSGVKDILGNQRGVNAQNIPSHSKEAARVRETWAAPPGRLLGVWDYSQLELRIVAHYMADFLINKLQAKGKKQYTITTERRNRTVSLLSLEPLLLKAFLDGLDPHQMTADAAGVIRDVAKTINFGTLYGMGPRMFMEAVELATGLRIKQKEATEWLEGFGKAYPEYPIWKDAVIRYCRNLGYIQTIAGRRRRLPDINSRDWGYKSRAERQAVNAIIQGSAADIMNYANKGVQDIIRSTEFFRGVLCIGQVHDELAVEGTKEQLYKLSEPAQKIMIDAGKHFNLITPLQVDGGIGVNWKEAK
jgi:DNA polymerase-1